MTSPSSLNWLFVDLNSYFASVEQEINPKLRGRPVGVVPMLAETTVCIAASYEAKKFGVKTGTMVRDARRMCPGMIFVEARHEEYVDYHHKIVEAVESCLPVTSVMSIDEMACRLTGRDQKIENAIELGHEVKKKILKVGSQLFSSVGIGPNRFLSKVASDMQKPNGLTVIRPEDLPHKLFSLKLRDLPGIGAKMEARLYEKNIRTVEQLLAQNQLGMKTIWGGVNGEVFYQWLLGKDIDTTHEENKSIGHSHVLPPHLRNAEGSYAIAQKLLQKAAVRLRRLNAWCTKLQVSIRYIDQRKWSEYVNMLECQDTLTLQEAFRKIWPARIEGAPLKVSVTLLDLVADRDRNFSFFEDKGRVRLSHAIDSINMKYGKNTVHFGGTHTHQMSAPTRIAFSKIPDYEFE